MVFDPGTDKRPEVCGYSESEPASDMPGCSPADIMHGLDRAPTPEERAAIQNLGYRVVQAPDAKDPGSTKVLDKVHKPKGYPSEETP